MQTSVSPSPKTRRRPTRPAAPATTPAAPAAARSQARITCDPQVVKTALKRVHRGVDFLKVNYWISWESPDFLQIMKFMKGNLQDTEDRQVACFRSKGLEWNLQRTGTNKFSYILKAGDVTLLFSPREPKGNMPNFRVEIGSLTSQTQLFQTLNDIKHWLERHEAEFLKERVAEVHLAADFIGLDIKTLDVENQEKWIHRSHLFNPHYEHKKLTGVSIGKGDFALRIYDKVVELKRSENKQQVFRDLWQVQTFDEHPVTRVEYQLRRPVLKQFNHLEFCNGVDTVKQLLFSLRALWKYCTTDWCRFTALVVDRANKNQQRAINSEFWEIVSCVAWSGVERLRREKPIKHKDIDSLRKQVRGICMSIAAFFVQDPEQIDQIVSLAKDHIERDLRDLYENRPDFIRRMDKKRNEVLLDTVPF